MTKNDKSSSSSASSGSLGSQSSQATSTSRGQAFRKRLLDVDLKRWEITGSQKTRDQVKEIADIEGLSAGLAAEALLALGVETYFKSPMETPSSFTVPSEVFSRAPDQCSFFKAGTTGADEQNLHAANPVIVGSASAFSLASTSASASASGSSLSTGSMNPVTPFVADSSSSGHLVLRSAFRTSEGNSLLATGTQSLDDGLQPPKKLAYYSERISGSQRSKIEGHGEGSGADSVNAFFEKAQKRRQKK